VTTLLEALTRFLEADAALIRDKYVARKTPTLQRQAASMFKKQGRLFLSKFSSLRKEVDANAAKLAEAVSSSDWLPLWYETAAATAGNFSGDLETAILDALLFSGGNLFDELQADELDIGISWKLENPRAAAYAKTHAAGQVKLIDDTTRDGLNGLISQATEEGWSYTRLSEAIGSKFVEFATGGDNPRSRRIAVYELGDAYEAGNEMAAYDLQKAGLTIQKKWLTVGDDKVRPTHTENQSAGWIDLDDSFPSGNGRPPSDPGCRCVTLHRRKPS